MNETAYKLQQAKNPITNDFMWKVEDIALAKEKGSLSVLVERFIRQYPRPTYSLTVYETLSGGTIEIECEARFYSQVAENIYLHENATLKFISLDSITDSYTVGMAIRDGSIDFGRYRYVNGKLTKK